MRRERERLMPQKYTHAFFRKKKSEWVGGMTQNDAPTTHNSPGFFPLKKKKHVQKTNLHFHKLIKEHIPTTLIFLSSSSFISKGHRILLFPPFFPSWHHFVLLFFPIASSLSVLLYFHSFLPRLPPTSLSSSSAGCPAGLPWSSAGGRWRRSRPRRWLSGLKKKRENKLS